MTSRMILESISVFHLFLFLLLPCLRRLVMEVMKSLFAYIMQNDEKKEEEIEC